MNPYQLHDHDITFWWLLSHDVTIAIYAGILLTGLFDILVITYYSIRRGYITELACLMLLLIFPVTFKFGISIWARWLRVTNLDRFIGLMESPLWAFHLTPLLFCLATVGYKLLKRILRSIMLTEQFRDNVDEADRDIDCR